jgi:hypothetical protein
MNLRHAAALALVGWYLMVPQPDAPGRAPNVNAPLSQWNQMGAFDSASNCEKERESRRRLAVKALDEVQQEIDAVPDSTQPLVKVAPKVAQDSVDVSSFAIGIEASRCVASDDPRLRKK